MTEIRDIFITWLRDAHAAEEQALTMLGAQAGRLDHYPALRNRILQHQRETEEQRDILEAILDRYDVAGSLLKDLSAKVMAGGQAMGGMMAGDEVIKGSMASYTFEQMEIAAYTVLIETAHRLGDSQTAADLVTILRQEEAMAAWLIEHMPDVVDTYLSRLADGETAKR